MTNDQLTAIRARLDALAEVEAQATPAPWWMRGPGHGEHGQPVATLAVREVAADVMVMEDDSRDAAAIVALRNAAPALIAVARAAAQYAREAGPYWWAAYHHCQGCSAAAEVATDIPHAPDCPAVALDAALAALADAGGEVGKDARISEAIADLRAGRVTSMPLAEFMDELDRYGHAGAGGEVGE